MSDRLKEWKDKYGAPNIIYLQLHGDDDPELVDDPFVDCTQDVSWCWEMINEFDVEYIRMDLHKNQIDSLTKERDKWKCRAENILTHLNKILEDEYSQGPEKLEDFDNE